MSEIATPTYTVFAGQRRLAAGALAKIAVMVKHALADDAVTPILIYDDSTGRAIDLDTRGADAEVAARYAVPSMADTEPRGRGRPKLGVVAREVTLLPRHWDWLGSQPGGASVALRKLVEDARGKGSDRQRRRAAQDAAYHFMSAMAGNFPDFEDAIRALYADDRTTFETLTESWPTDIRDHARKLGFVA